MESSIGWKHCGYTTTVKFESKKGIDIRCNSCKSKVKISVPSRDIPDARIKTRIKNCPASSQVIPEWGQGDPLPHDPGDMRL